MVNSYWIIENLQDSLPKERSFILANLNQIMEARVMFFDEPENIILNDGNASEIILFESVIGSSNSIQKYGNGNGLFAIFDYTVLDVNGLGNYFKNTRKLPVATSLKNKDNLEHTLWKDLFSTKNDFIEILFPDREKLQEYISLCNRINVDSPVLDFSMLALTESANEKFNKYENIALALNSLANDGRSFVDYDPDKKQGVSYLFVEK